MNKKYISVLIIFFTIILIGSIVLTNQNFLDNIVNHNDTIELGSLSIKMPNGYKLNGSNDIGDTVIQNGTNAIYLSQINTSNLEYNINSYMKELEDNNFTPSRSNFTINNITVYKVIAQGTGTAHYWFENEGKVYTIYSWDGNKNMDATVNEIVGSI